ncbi:MAG TPA: PqiC family protein [Nevskiaceae bacterium]|nr:PqiC family protein [Nevskiaceae bacterium]
MKRVSGWALLALATLLAGCASPAQIRYYTLVAPQPAKVATAPADLDIEVAPVVVPRALRRRAMVLREGPAELLVQDNHQWITPLPDQLHAALAADLVAKLGTHEVTGAAAAMRPVYRVSLTVTHFDAVYGGTLWLAARWSIARLAPTAAARPLLTCPVQVRQSAGASYVALAEAAQRDVGQVATQIAAALRALPARTCPPMPISDPAPQ